VVVVVIGLLLGDALGEFVDDDGVEVGDIVTAVTSLLLDGIVKKCPML
jgi:hypothetical protein